MFLVDFDCDNKVGMIVGEVMFIGFVDLLINLIIFCDDVDLDVVLWGEVGFLVFVNEFDIEFGLWSF